MVSGHIRARVGSLWRAYWDPESEILVLTLSSAVLAGIGIALILMGAMPTAPPEPPAGAIAAEMPVARPAAGSAAQARSPAKKAVKKAAQKAAKKHAAKKPAARPAIGALGRSVPLTLDIPAIGVHTSLMTLGLKADGTVQVPPLTAGAPAGWYRNLASPGEAGPAVILGHVDSARDGPAVFYRLRELRRGDRLTVQRADGRTVRFAVRSVASYPKQNFPTAAVYGPRPGAELRLVTCGGSFDALRRHYRDNIVVYATMTGSSRPRAAPPS
jgi:sortase (surface protein transpeptidase)